MWCAVAAGAEEQNRFNSMWRTDPQAMFVKEYSP
jgi:hypothetical protein